LNGVVTLVVATLASMRGEIPEDVAALLEQFDRRIEESQALRVKLQQKMAERDEAAEQSADEMTGADKSTQCD
jgi:cell division septum initiation protein DivIVA